MAKPWSALVVALVLTASPGAANPASEALRRRAADDFYNLDLGRAAELYRQAIAADPDDAAAHRGLASALWTSLIFGRGMLTVDSYLGGVSRRNQHLPPPPADLAAAFRSALERATALARRRVAADPRNVQAQFELGTAIGLDASYMATIDGGVLGAFRAARHAYDAHERVLRLDPTRRDAGLIVGTYRYLVSTFALPLRWAAYAAGFGGGRQRGLQLVEAAATYPGENQADARIALLLLFNRERRYDAALAQLEQLRTRYPRNRLLWLEAGATALRAGRAAEAERLLADGFERLQADGRPRMFSEDALWLLKRGAARAALGRTADAERDLRKATSLEARRWVHGRARLELGKLALKAGNRPAAKAELGQAIALCESDNDLAFAAEARRLMR